MPRFRNLSAAGTGFRYKRIYEDLNKAKERLNEALEDPKQCCTVFLETTVESQ